MGRDLVGFLQHRDRVGKVLGQNGVALLHTLKGDIAAEELLHSGTLGSALEIEHLPGSSGGLKSIIHLLLQNGNLH